MLESGQDSKVRDYSVKLQREFSGMVKIKISDQHKRIFYVKSTEEGKKLVKALKKSADFWA